MANHSLMYFFNVGRRLFSLGKIDFILAKNCQSLFAIGQSFALNVVSVSDELLN